MLLHVLLLQAGDAEDSDDDTTTAVVDTTATTAASTDAATAAAAATVHTAECLCAEVAAVCDSISLAAYVQRLCKALAALPVPAAAAVTDLTADDQATTAANEGIKFVAGLCAALKRVVKV
jgi:hypothetical protein